MRNMALLIYAKDCERLAQFYAGVAGLRVSRREPGLICLQGAGVELLLHALPEAIASSIEIGVPPQRREDCALKPIFGVSELATALVQVQALGGVGFADEAWGDDEARVCNAMDPEGNVLQLREPLRR